MPSVSWKTQRFVAGAPNTNRNVISSLWLRYPEINDVQKQHTGRPRLTNSIHIITTFRNSSITASQLVEELHNAHQASVSDRTIENSLTPYKTDCIIYKKSCLQIAMDSRISRLASSIIESCFVH